MSDIHTQGNSPFEALDGDLLDVSHGGGRAQGRAVFLGMRAELV